MQDPNFKIGVTPCVDDEFYRQVMGLLPDRILLSVIESESKQASGVGCWKDVMEHSGTLLRLAFKHDLPTSDICDTLENTAAALLNLSMSLKRKEGSNG